MNICFQKSLIHEKLDRCHYVQILFDLVTQTKILSHFRQKYSSKLCSNMEQLIKASKMSCGGDYQLK